MHFLIKNQLPHLLDSADPPESLTDTTAQVNGEKQFSTSWGYKTLEMIDVP